jgi:colanic acid biosynthesis glycosyl transferase WcaI
MLPATTGAWRYQPSSPGTPRRVQPVSAARGKRPARVFFVNRYFHPDESATSRILSDLVFRLAAQGLSVAVVTSRQLYEDPHAQLPSAQTIRGVAVHRVATARLGRSRLLGRALDYVSFHAAVAWRLSRLLGPGDIVVAKTDPPLLSVTLSHVAAWRGARLMNWLQDVFPEVAVTLAPGILPKPLQAPLMSMRDRSLKSATMNIVLSEGMRERVCARGVEPGKTIVIPNWADTKTLTPRAAAASFTRRRLGLTDRFVIGYSGNFGRAHEFDTLMTAAKLLNDDARFAFLMTGGGARSQGLQHAVAQAHLTNFHFQGYQPAQWLSDSMAAADIHLVSLLPALEGLIVPSKVYGILAAGRPVVFIGDTRGDIAQLIREHDCGISVAVGAGAQLAEGFRSLRADPARVQLMGVNARRLALARYTGEHAAEDWLRLLAEITDREPVEQYS